MRSLAGAGLIAHLSPADADAFEAAATRWQSGGSTSRLLARDATLWTGADESRWMGWLEAPNQSLGQIPVYADFAAAVHARRFTHVLLLGMGGSSMWPEVLSAVFGSAPGFPAVLVLDSTDPSQIRAFERRIRPESTLFVVASKSGSTIEPNLLADYFHARLVALVGAERAGEQFVAITDPGSALEKRAAAQHYWRVFKGVSAIGGRYSALSAFGMVPAAALGLDLHRLLESAMRVRAATEAQDPGANPGVALGLMIGELARSGRDKLTLVASPGVAAIGAWIEQLVAESLGKTGKGIVPVDAEPLGGPAAYASDRVFVHLRFAEELQPEADTAMQALRDAGHPVIRIDIANRYDIAGEVVRWCVATAVAGAVLGVNPFDQPDVEAAKVAARDLLTDYESTGRMPVDAPIASTGALSVFAKPAPPSDSASMSVDAAVRTLLASIAPGDYLGVLAFIEMNASHTAVFQRLRLAVRDAKKIATTLGYGPRYLHSSGQMHKGGPDTGVFLVVTCDEPADLPVPGRKATFGVVKISQGRGDFEVLLARGRRALRVHITGSVNDGLLVLEEAVRRALAV